MVLLLAMWLDCCLLPQVSQLWVLSTESVVAAGVVALHAVAVRSADVF